MSTVAGWVWFVLVQLMSAAAAVVGWFLLIPFCLLQAWVPTPSTFNPARTIDRWRWSILNFVYGNPEDGVSGTYAWTSAVLKTPYMPGSNPAWRAYCWQFRNSADNLKYVFAWGSGPFYSRVIFGRTLKMGWQKENGLKVLVWSL